MSTTIRVKSCNVELVENYASSQCDALCIINPSHIPSGFKKTFDEFSNFDKAFLNEVSVLRSENFSKPIIFSPVGDLTDYDDVRAVQNAAAKAVRRAIKAGSRRPCIIVSEDERFQYSELCTILGALHELYVPVQLRNDRPEKAQRIDTLLVQVTSNRYEPKELLRNALTLEQGKDIARDIGVGDPEYMTAPNIEEYVRKNCNELGITVISDINELQTQYPLFAAVNRAASVVERHRGRIIYLHYKPPSTAVKSLLLVGKGVTYDTGGADIKAGGVMAGMSRDKCGAAAVAGFMRMVQQCKPRDIEVIGALCLVRNSVGEECYVSDEIITSRAGVRVRVGNTDAEGRMCMTDALCYMKELATKMTNPHLYTIATLTGHACMAVGTGYSIVIDNSVAVTSKHALKLKEIGDEIGDPFEISTLRKDDFNFNEAKVIGEDVVQANDLPSSRTPRGHQVPASFMIVASGLDKHDLKSSNPLKYSHIDIAASAGDYPHMPTGAPITALAKLYLEL